MATINIIRARISSLSIKDESYKAVLETKQDITNIQKEQLLHGLDAGGNKLRKYRGRKYALAKAFMNPLPGFGNPDLNLTGSFYAGFETVVNPISFATHSADPKNEFLVKKYDPFGLNIDSKNEYIKELRPVFIKNVRQKLQL